MWKAGAGLDNPKGLFQCYVWDFYEFWGIFLKGKILLYVPSQFIFQRAPAHTTCSVKWDIGVLFDRGQSDANCLSASQKIFPVHRHGYGQKTRNSFAQFHVRFLGLCTEACKVFHMTSVLTFSRCLQFWLLGCVYPPYDINSFTEWKSLKEVEEALK